MTRIQSGSEEQGSVEWKGLSGELLPVLNRISAMEQQLRTSEAELGRERRAAEDRQKQFEQAQAEWRRHREQALQAYQQLESRYQELDSRWNALRMQASQHQATALKQLDESRQSQQEALHRARQSEQDQAKLAQALEDHRTYAQQLTQRLQELAQRLAEAQGRNADLERVRLSLATERDDLLKKTQYLEARLPLLEQQLRAVAEAERKEAVQTASGALKEEVARLKLSATQAAREQQQAVEELERQRLDTIRREEQQDSRLKRLERERLDLGRLVEQLRLEREQQEVRLQKDGRDRAVALERSQLENAKLREELLKLKFELTAAQARGPVSQSRVNEVSL